MYNQANCHSYIRRYRKLDYGLEPVVVIVTGQHAFKWSVTIKKGNKMSTIRFDNRIFNWGIIPWNWRKKS